MCFCCYLLMSYLKLCNDFSNLHLRFLSIKMKRFSVSEDNNRIDS